LEIRNPQRNDVLGVGLGLIGTGVMGLEKARFLNRDIPGADLAGVFDVDAACAAVFSPLDLSLCRSTSRS
jgi:hypothetical protein